MISDNLTTQSKLDCLVLLNNFWSFDASSIHFRGSLRPEKSSNSFCHCDICPTFLQHLWDVSQCDFGPRFGRFLRPSTEFICFRSTHPWVAKYWQVLKHTLELCSHKQPFEAERTLFFAFLGIFSSFTVFYLWLFDSSNLDFKKFQVSTDESSNPASQHLSFNHLLANAMGSSDRMCKCYMFCYVFLVLKTNKLHMFDDALNSSMPCHWIFQWFLSDFVSVPTWPMLRLLSAARPQSLTFARYLQRWHQISNKIRTI